MSALATDGSTSSHFLFDAYTTSGVDSFYTSPEVGADIGDLYSSAPFGIVRGSTPKLNGESHHNNYTNGGADFNAVCPTATRNLFINGTWTVDIVFRPTDVGPYHKGTLFAVGGNGTWATADDNVLFSLYRDTNQLDIGFMWQSAAGAKTRKTVAVAFEDEWNIISVSCEPSVAYGSRLKVTVHHNGVLMGVWDNLAYPTGGSTAPYVKVLNPVGAEADDDQYRFEGDVDELRISSVHRSNADCVTAAATIVSGTGVTLSVPAVFGNATEQAEPYGIGARAIPELEFDRNNFYRQGPTYGAEAEPVRVVSEVVTSGDIRITLDVPMRLDPGTITHGGTFFDVNSLALSGDKLTLIQNIGRFLRRISKLNRGTN